MLEVFAMVAPITVDTLMTDCQPMRPRRNVILILFSSPDSFFSPRRDNGEKRIPTPHLLKTIHPLAFPEENPAHGS